MSVTKEKVLEWKKVAGLAKELKEREMKLRKEIVGALVGNVSKRTIKKAEVGDIKMKATFETSTDIADKDELMEDREGMPPELQECFPLKPSFSKTAYKKLSEDQQEEVDVYLITKPAAPKLEIIP